MERVEEAKKKGHVVTRKASTTEGSGMKRKKIIIISPNAEERFRKLDVLLRSKKAGNNVGLDEFTAILDSLLDEKKIDKKGYSRFIRAWKRE